MKSIAFFNNKGGVGKTTLLCNIAAYFAELGLRVCVVDCDPQCNASQYLFHDEKLEDVLLYKQKNIESLFTKLMVGEGHTSHLPVVHSDSFDVDVVCGSPGLSMVEDFLAEEWAHLNTPRGLSSTMVFHYALRSLNKYDYVFFDVGPSLSSINRTVLLSSDYFVSPVSIDIFSLKAFENISLWMTKWKEHWDYSINSPQFERGSNTFTNAKGVKGAKFIGYVSQQYIAKRDSYGSKRPVKSFDEIIKQIDGQIDENFKGDLLPPQPYKIGSIPNLHSLVPMSQSRRKPIFALLAADGVVGAHFAKIKEAKEVFGQVADGIRERVK